MANMARPGEKFEVFVSYKLHAKRSLAGFPGKLGTKHSHVFRIDVRFESDTLDERGVTVDFEQVKKAVGGAIGDLQDAYLNDVPDFAGEKAGEIVNPTGEVVARVIWDRVEPALAAIPAGIKLKQVIVAESPSCKILYTR